MIFAYKKSKGIKSIFTLILNLLLIQIFSNYFFGINFYGNYATSSIENSSNFKLLLGLNHSQRILINDYYLTNPNPSAVSINIARDNENLNQLIQSL